MSGSGVLQDSLGLLEGGLLVDLGEIVHSTTGARDVELHRFGEACRPQGNDQEASFLHFLRDEASCRVRVDKDGNVPSLRQVGGILVDSVVAGLRWHGKLGIASSVVRDVLRFRVLILEGPQGFVVRAVSIDDRFDDKRRLSFENLRVSWFCGAIERPPIRQ